MSEERYDLKASKKAVDELYPILKDAHGNIIDGFHRLESVPEWHDETKENIRTNTQLWLARIIANTHRRQISREERAQQLTELAKSLIENDKVPKDEVIQVIADLTTFTVRYVQELISDEYKRSYHKSELSSQSVKPSFTQSQVTVPAGSEPESPVSEAGGSFILPSAVDKGTPAEHYAIESEVTEDTIPVSVPPFKPPPGRPLPKLNDYPAVKAYLDDVSSRNYLSGSEDWIAPRLVKSFSLKMSEAEEMLREWAKDRNAQRTKVQRPASRKEIIADGVCTVCKKPFVVNHVHPEGTHTVEEVRQE